MKQVGYTSSEHRKDDSLYTKINEANGNDGTKVLREDKHATQ